MMDMTDEDLKEFGDAMGDVICKITDSDCASILLFSNGKQISITTNGPVGVLHSMLLTTLVDLAGKHPVLQDVMIALAKQAVQERPAMLDPLLSDFTKN